jgi:hypothetical protein
LGTSQLLAVVEVVKVAALLVPLLRAVQAAEVVQAALRLERLALLDKETLAALLKVQAVITHRAVAAVQVLRVYPLHLPQPPAVLGEQVFVHPLLDHLYFMQGVGAVLLVQRLVLAALGAAAQVQK